MSEATATLETMAQRFVACSRWVEGMSDAEHGAIHAGLYGDWFCDDGPDREMLHRAPLPDLGDEVTVAIIAHVLVFEAWAAVSIIRHEVVSYRITCWHPVRSQRDPRKFSASTLAEACLLALEGADVR